MRVSISVKEDVKLHESENAWRPARFNPSAEDTEDDKKTHVSISEYNFDIPTVLIKSFVIIYFRNCIKKYGAS